jgi:uncharacterized heparinase superfamily protein
MSSLTRYAAAIYHLGPQQVGRNLTHRLRLTPPFRRYARTSSGLGFAGRRSVPFLPHDMATRLADGRFTAVGATRTVGDPPDWSVPAPLLWVFNLHYFAFLEALPRERQLSLVLDWIDRYPPDARRPGWMAYPLSLRLRHWTRRLLEADWPTLTRNRVIASIEGQANCLADHLEWHLRGNHLLENVLTLKMMAACFRGVAPGRWERLASPVLEAEMAEQFLPDGGHFERSPMYHAQLVLSLLDLLNILPAEDRLVPLLRERMPSLLRFLSALRHPDGRIAPFNDAALDIAPEPDALLAYAAALGFDAPAAGSASFPQTGYHVWRSGNDALLVDAGPIGPDYLPGHGHGDLFSYELSLDGRRVVVDGGTSTYEAGSERDWVRSTRAHNTVEIAGESQCEFFAAFRVGRRGRPRDVTAIMTPEGLHVAGWHDGYRRLPGRPVHHREIEMTAERALLVWDTVESAVAHQAVSRVRFAPGTRVTVETPERATVEAHGRRLVLEAFGGALALEEGQYAPRFGERLPCPVLALRKGGGPEFGYALAPREAAVGIDAAGAEVGGRRVPRRARRGPRA